MLFNSIIYIFAFLPVVALIYFILNKQKQTVAAKAWLVIASLFFYAYWNYLYLPLILSSIIINYFIGEHLKKDADNDASILTNNKFWLTTGIMFNLALLAYFKYADFFISNTNWIFDSEIGLLELALPLAISFFTFQQIAFLVDCYYSRAEEHDFLSYSLFVTFFPQLIAGPIVHHKEMMPQFLALKNKIVNARHIAQGVYIFSIGLFKKIVIADAFSVWARAGFDQAVPLTFFEAWGTSLSYTFQLYYDFSGYCDMAIGSALIFNIKLPINFNSPYKAVNIQDFWRRWHITLSRWLRDHIYIPLGGNRKGHSQTLANIFITFLIGGLWHGAGWTFVIWGALHGGAMIIHRLWQRAAIQLPVLTSWLITFMFVNITWVFFRATTFDDANRVLSGMLGLNGIKISQSIADNLGWLRPWFNSNVAEGNYDFIFSIEVLGYILTFAAMAFFLPNSTEMIKYRPGAYRACFPARLKTAVYAGMIASAAITGLLMTKESEFIYFHF